MITESHERLWKVGLHLVVVVVAVVVVNSGLNLTKYCYLHIIGEESGG